MLRKESRAAVPVALYVRTLAGDPNNSLPVQFYALETYALRCGLDAVRVYFDVQGGRSQFVAMMAEVAGEDPPFRQVLVHDPDRLSGLADGQGEMRDLLDGNGVTVLFLKKPKE